MKIDYLSAELLVFLVLFSILCVVGCINPYEDEMKGVDQFMEYQSQVKQINQNAADAITNKNWPELLIQANNLKTMSNEELKSIRTFKTKASPDFKPIFEDLERVVIADTQLAEDIDSLHNAYITNDHTAFDIASGGYKAHWEERSNNMIEAGTKLKALGKKISGE